MRVLVTGASGFVGRALTRSLSRAGYHVRAAARSPAKVPAAEFVEIVPLPDLSRPVNWQPLLTDVDAIVHLAGIAHVSRVIPDSDYDRINRVATKELALPASLAPNIRRLVFVSSIRAQTGPTADTILTERDPPQPTDAYGRSKLAAEAFVNGYGVPATILRPVVIYGRGAQGNVAQLVKLSRLPLPLPFGAFDQRRSLLALENMLSAIRFVLERPATAGETYIVSDPTALSLAEMIAILRQARRRSPKLTRLPKSWLRASLKLAGKTDAWDRIAYPSIAENAKLRDAGWIPPTDAPQALAKMAQRPH
jgi:nucleoside-diphosphate-sugar epimerase